MGVSSTLLTLFMYTLTNFNELFTGCDLISPLHLNYSTVFYTCNWHRFLWKHVTLIVNQTSGINKPIIALEFVTYIFVMVHSYYKHHYLKYIRNIRNIWRPA